MARIGENVRPELGRADTSGILLGSIAGAEAIGQGLAAAGQDLAAGMKEGRERKVKRKGAETRIEGLLAFYKDVPELTEKLTPLLHTLRSDEVRGREKDAIIGQVTPLMDMFRDTSLRALQKEARDVATAGRNIARTYDAADYLLRERSVGVAEKEAEARKLTGQAQFEAARGKGTFAEQEFVKAIVPDLGMFLTGGDSRARSHIEELNKVLDQLESYTGEREGGVNTGAFAGSVPRRFAADLATMDDTIGGIVNASLRQILGAQFTEAEGKRILGQSFDPTAPNEQNIVRVGRLRDELVNKYNDQKRYANQLTSLGTVFPDSRRGMTEEASLVGHITIGEDGRIVVRPGATPQAGQGTGAGADLRDLLGEEQGIPRPVPEGGDEFTGMLRDANFSAADLEAFRTGNNAQKVANLAGLRSRAGAGPEVGQNLSAEDKLRVMERALTPELEMKGAPTTQEIQEAERALSGGPQPPAPGAPPISGPAPLPPESMRNIVREGQPAIYNPRLEGLSPEQIRPIQFGDPLSPEQEAHRRRQVEELELKGGSEEIELRDTRYEIPGGSATLSLGDQKFRATTEDEGTRVRLEELLPEPPRRRIPDEIKENVRVLDVTRDVANLPPEIKSVVSLDSNAGAKGSRPQGIEMVLATSLKNKPGNPKVVQSKNYVKAVRDFFTKHGLDRKIRRKGTEGILYKFSKSRMMYTEPFFLSDTKARKVIEDNPREYARIVLNTLGKIPGVTIIPPHTSNDPGETFGGVNERDWAKKFIIPYLKELTAE